MVKLVEGAAPATTVGSSLLDAYCKVRKVTAVTPTRVMLVGQSNEGKTVTAASMSEFFPDKLPAAEPVNLADMLWILHDGDGLLAFPSLGLHVDCIDLTTVPLEKLEAVTNGVLDRVAEMMVANGEKKIVVFDSLSTYAAKLQGRIKDADDLGGGNTGYWDRVLSAQTKTFAKLMSIPGPVVAICHLKAIMVMRSKDSAANELQDAKLLAADMEPGDIHLDISGKAREYYWNNFANIWPVQSEGKEGKREFFLYPFGCGKIRGKSKFENLNRKEPANLRKLFSKIRGEKT